MRTIVIALLVNLAVAVIKAIAGVLTASAGLLAEAAHSVGDCTTELFLMTAVRRSDKPADTRHPFGYGKERYFWSLLAALTIFTLGAGFSIYQGISTIVGGESDSSAPYIGYIVIALSAIVEGASLRQAVGRTKRESKRSGMSFRAYLRDPDDPTVKSVVLEDSAAMIGLAIAAAGLLLRQVTGNSGWDGVAALAIGVLLVVVAFELARTNVGLLIGKQANPHLVEDIRAALDERPEVIGVVDVLTMMMGTGKVLVCARLDYAETLSADEVEGASVRIHADLAGRFDDVQDIFIEAVPRDDQGVRGAAEARATESS
ncbi:MAG TPA: cation diffusion facilitator family transporter [Micromonosporaceae bacterium]|jgi:cation diffusion facilitator family transporter